MFSNAEDPTVASVKRTAMICVAVVLVALCGQAAYCHHVTGEQCAECIDSTERPDDCERICTYGDKTG